MSKPRNEPEPSTTLTLPASAVIAVAITFANGERWVIKTKKKDQQNDE
jgi:hypothetical protein